jgi:hypothetical protein
MTESFPSRHFGAAAVNISKDSVGPLESNERKGAILMKSLTRLVCSLALLGALPLAPLAAQNKGVGPWRPVKDDIGFFSPQAEEQANKKVAELKKEFNKDLFIEAMKAPPHPKDLNFNDKAAVDRFFDQFAEKRFADLNENGVYVMIVDHPHKLRVVVGNSTVNQGYFTRADRDALAKKMIEKLKLEDKDGALLTATNYVFDTMKANHPNVNRRSEVAPVAHDGGGNARAAGFSWSPILTILAVVAGVWILFAVIRGLFGSAGSGGMGGPGMGYGGGGGGGFFSNFLGGMFGAAAGMWMYNNFFGGHSGSSAWGAGPTDAGASYPDSGPADTSGSAGGGDYGNDAGGGDWGGGDAGGGDAGGGDWGGGGGDWGGGGGGDWGGGGGGGDW